jgi:hypothetical protein
VPPRASFSVQRAVPRPECVVEGRLLIAES